ncbi:MAG: hypothetical protein AAF628_31485 [Planctomycetota bacterium]
MHARTITLYLLAIAGVANGLVAQAPLGEAPARRAGERVAAADRGPGWIETMAAVLARRDTEQARAASEPTARGASRARLGIALGREVNVRGLWIARCGTLGGAGREVAVIGRRNGVAVGRTVWRDESGDQPTWWAVELPGVDRLEFESASATPNGGWYVIDDLALELDVAGATRAVVADFVGLEPGARLAGAQEFALALDGERDAGFRAELQPTAPDHRPPSPVHTPEPAVSPTTVATPPARRGRAVSGGTPRQTRDGLVLGRGFVGPSNYDVGTVPVADTNGAVGPNHYVATPNGHLAIYDRFTGQKVLDDLAQTTFWGIGGQLGDPRVLYDHHHDRFLLIASDWAARIYFAYSLTADPTAGWFKTSFNTAQGADAGRWPDYPTLGLDANGIYLAATMVPAGAALTATIFAIDKAPLLRATPALGTITAWRRLPNDWAVQPCVTFGPSSGAYLVSTGATPEIRLRRVSGPLTNPSLLELGLVDIPPYQQSPNAPQRGSSTSLRPGSSRLMNAVYRNEAVWTVHDVAVEGKASVRWYQIDPNSVSLRQAGNVTDPVRSYFMPSLSVNVWDDLLIGFTGSSPSEYPSVYATGRRPSYPAGRTDPPVLLRAGTSPFTAVSGRWGDYSATGIDPRDDATFWTIQEYATARDVWANWIQELRY